MYSNKRIIKLTARVLLLSMGMQLVCPVASMALTSGPSQPEVKSFEPVGTTDMVDLFTGDFVYNIPLMDVEGYPVNIAYHSGGDMEQEASWVGLGWNINPGVINRSVRGMPDDFNGEQISKSVNIKPEKNVRVGLGLGAELAGVGSPMINLSANLGVNVNVSNYRGVSADLSLGAGVNVMGFASAGINVGVGSQTGADIDYNAGIRFSTSMIMSSDVGAGIGVNYGHGYNTRTGVKDRSFSISTNVSIGGKNLQGPSWTATVPCGYNNVIPVITNSSTMTMYRGQIKLGGELFSVFGHVAVYGMVSTLSFSGDGSKKGYGYLYAQNADDASIMDFTRDKDGMFNETMSYLPAGSMTYDVYSVAGQGTGGSFRPFRNDYGSVYDPAVSSNGSDFSLNIEAGIGNLFEIGGDGTLSNTDITSGPWQDHKRPFSQKTPGSIYENTYFKQAGELTETNPGLFQAIQGTNPVTGTQTAGMPLKKPGSDTRRDARANMVYYFTGEEASIKGVASSDSLYSYTTSGFTSGGNADKTRIPRVDGVNRKAHHISEIVQVQTDGRRYVYGLPAINTSQHEVTFATENSDMGNGMVSYTTEAAASNNKGRDHYFSKTSTPPFAHSYLLTSVLSADYVDVLGDGVTDDDFGSYTKFNYTRKETDYKWKAPYGAGLAQFNAGFKSDSRDNKASFLEGSREQWILHSIETRNFVAEFYTSAREDAKDATKTASSYKLDKIILYNKHDRFINGKNAVPIKTVVFGYDYSLCPGIPNSSNGGGKLTLNKISIGYGNSERGMISPYKFEYFQNKSYSVADKDRWGAYKPNNPALPNVDFPFVNQADPQLNLQAGAWSLNRIHLPSGGTIQVFYEADDYAYVQDKEAMEMCLLSGLGNSPDYSGGNQLYFDKNSPNRYFYFNRRIAAEQAGMSFRDIYFKNQDILYYNFDIRLVNNAKEPIKGYAEVEEVGQCSDGIHGYVKVKPVEIKGGGASINPATYTALNFGRYYLPHILFPGSDPDASGISNILSGIRYAFSELVSFSKNPIKRMVEEGKARDVNLATSYMRLTSPGLKKKGGGQRVNTLAFYDNWNNLAGGNTFYAAYGKTYEYTTKDQGSGGTISSGVASYEPQIGGDENPFRLPVYYAAQKASNWPPNDPVGLYQELPVGESLYPAPVVGYSRVTVKSLSQGVARSAQGMDIHDFYTAKDFPIQAQNTPLTDVVNESDYSLTEQKRMFQAAQGYTLVFNDMHGKPKRNEHRVIKDNNTSELVSYQQYIYYTENGKLSNNIPVIEYDAAGGKMKKVKKQVGVEADLTIDTREKKEHTQSNTLYLNLNVFLIGIFPVPIPWGYGYEFNMRNEFRSVVATKVVQQYGILKEVQSSQEGALTTVQNEAFDPVTGQALITSVNNEFKDKEFSVNYPAYWGYKSMGPSYANTGYTESFPQVSVADYAGILPTGSTFRNYNVGDELLISYTYNNVRYNNNVWVMDFKSVDSSAPPTPYQFDSVVLGARCSYYLKYWMTPEIANCLLNVTAGGPCLSAIPVPVSPAYPDEYYRGILRYSRTIYKTMARPVIKPRFKYRPSWPANGMLSNVSVKVVRSGIKNQLNESIQSYTGMSEPLDNSDYLKNDLDRLISISGSSFSDSLTMILPMYDSLLNPSGWDSLNEYVTGTRGIKRKEKDFVYLKNRDYPGNMTRNSGLFSATSLWNIGTPGTSNNTAAYCFILLDTHAVKNCIGDSMLTVIDAGPNWFTSTPAEVITNWCFNMWVERRDNIISPIPPFYNYLSLQPENDPNWLVSRTVTKWSPWGYELENKDAIGNYSAAIYGYNQQLPVALAQNARQHEIYNESLEDYQLLQVFASLTLMNLPPLRNLFPLDVITASSVYRKHGLSGSGFNINPAVAHTGSHSLETTSNPYLLLPAKTGPIVPGRAGYTPTLQIGKKYLVSYWFRPKTLTGLEQNYPISGSMPAIGMQLKSGIIEGWQKAETEYLIPAGMTSFPLCLPENAYVDDIRVLPADANMKTYVYHHINQKLIATLDENNFASFFEYDQEGSLVRTKKETEKGIMTITESRSANPKQ